MTVSSSSYRERRQSVVVFCEKCWIVCYQMDWISKCTLTITRSRWFYGSDSQRCQSRSVSVLSSPWTREACGNLYWYRRAIVTEKIMEYLVFKAQYEKATSKEEVPDFGERIVPELALETWVHHTVVLAGFLTILSIDWWPRITCKVRYILIVTFLFNWHWIFQLDPILYHIYDLSFPVHQLFSLEPTLISQWCLMIFSIPTKTTECSTLGLSSTPHRGEQRRLQQQ